MPEHTPVPTPHRAIYGFALFVFFMMLFSCWTLWAFVPDSILEHLGITFAPNKYFVLYIPVVVMFALTIFGWIIYPAMNLAITFDPDDERTLRDNFTIRRCKWVNKKNGRLCDKRVDLTPDSGWEVNSLCAVHSEPAGTVDGVGEDDRKIENFCDCVDRENCMLTKHPDHVKELLNRKTVPSVCDLDISDVCAQLFGQKIE